MQKLSAVKTLKPVGGVARVRLVPVGGEGIEMPLVEERSSYDEEILCDDGLLRVCHRLTLVLPREAVAGLMPCVAKLATEGASALVVTRAGEELTAGFSDTFEYEQPLRLTSLLIPSGARRADGNHAVMRLESEDTSAYRMDT